MAVYGDSTLSGCLSLGTVFALVRNSLAESAKKSKNGKDAKAAVICDCNPLIIYDGPKTADALWLDERFRKTCKAGVKGSSIMRTRPMFPEWGLSFEISYLPDVLNESELLAFLEVGGRLVGLGDWRPRYGRYELN